jgi:hypothetical protein
MASVQTIETSMIQIAAASLPESSIFDLMSTAPPIVVLVVVVFMFLKHMRERESSAQNRDAEFLTAIQTVVNEVRSMTDRSENVAREMVKVMGQATEALRRIDADLERKQNH